jgi:hypothetical protein
MDDMVRRTHYDQAQLNTLGGWRMSSSQAAHSAGLPLVANVVALST